MDLQENFLKV